MTIAFITGGTGFIGAALARRLLSEGVRVRALCRDVHKGEPLRELGAELVAGDVLLPESLQRGMEGCDTVYHVAAAMGGTGAVQYNVSVQGTRSMLQAAQHANVSRFIHVSSISAYGSHVAGVVNENHPLQPSRQDFYEQAKALSEQVLWQFSASTGLPVTVVRPGMVYGPGSNFWSKALYDVFSRVPLPIIGQGKGNAHPIYIDDLVDLMVRQASHPNAVGRAFNAASDPAPSWQQFVGSYARMAGNTRTVHIPTAPLYALAPIISAISGVTGEPLNLAGFLHYLTEPIVFSMRRAADLLEWCPRVSLDEGMANTARWLRSLRSSHSLQ